MADFKHFQFMDTVRVNVLRLGSMKAELSISISPRDLNRLMKFGQRKQIKKGTGGTFRWNGPFRLSPTNLHGKKRKKSTKPKPAPPIPRSTTRTTTRAKSTTKKKRKPSEYNLFVKKHRLAGKSMEQIGVMWRKKKR